MHFPIHGADKLLIKIGFIHHYNSLLLWHEFYHINPQGYLPFQSLYIKTQESKSRCIPIFTYMQHSWSPGPLRARPGHPSSRSNYRQGETPLHRNGAQRPHTAWEPPTILGEARALKGSLPVNSRIVSKLTGLATAAVREPHLEEPLILVLWEVATAHPYLAATSLTWSFHHTLKLNKGALRPFLTIAHDAWSPHIQK